MPAMGAALAAAGLNPIWLAQSKLRRRRFDECIEICTDVLQANPYDQVGAGSTLREQAVKRALNSWGGITAPLPGGVVPQVPGPHAQELDR